MIGGHYSIKIHFLLICGLLRNSDCLLIPAKRSTSILLEMDLFDAATKLKHLGKLPFGPSTAMPNRLRISAVKVFLSSSAANVSFFIWFQATKKVENCRVRRR